jgi:uncharacterized protein YigE (DUF2233 family)
MGIDIATCFDPVFTVPVINTNTRNGIGVVNDGTGQFLVGLLGDCNAIKTCRNFSQIRNIDVGQ